MRLDAGKKVKGRRRRVMVGTDGRALVLQTQPAGVQDRDGAVPILKLSRRAFPFGTKAFADAGYGGAKPAMATIIDRRSSADHPNMLASRFILGNEL